jgi:hypothetical protein
MGHKGVSKRKPKQNKYNVGASAFSDVSLSEGLSVQALVKDKDININRGALNPNIGSNKKGKKDRR